jgi:hypothetical protein
VWHGAGWLTVGPIFVEFCFRDDQCWHGPGWLSVCLILVDFFCWNDQCWHRAGWLSVCHIFVEFFFSLETISVGTGPDGLLFALCLLNFL